MKRLSIWLATLALLVIVSGCVRESIDGDTRVFQYELWLSGLVLLGGFIAAVAGWFLKSQSKRFGWVLLIGGAIAAIGVAPSLFLDRVEVRPDSFSRHSGIWGMTAVQEVNFDDVRQMRLVEREERGRRGRRVMRAYLVCDLKNAEPVELPASNDVSMAAMPPIIKNAIAHGINVTGSPN